MLYQVFCENKYLPCYFVKLVLFTTILLKCNTLYQRMLCVKFGYSCICGSGEEDEKFMTTTTCSNVTTTDNGQLNRRTRNRAMTKITCIF